MQTHHFWAPSSTRELDSTPLANEKPTRIVACLNVWNDLNALKQTISSWFPFVDAIIAVDGSYAAIDQGLSTDGTREFLAGLKKPVTIIDGAGLDQCAKRSLYFQDGKPGDLLFIVDADESIIGGQNIRDIPMCDVGWLRVTSKLYTRQYGQPRFIRWTPGLEYRGRHHWIYRDDRLLCTHQYSGPGFEHRPVNVSLVNQRHLGRDVSRLRAKRANCTEQRGREGAEYAMETSKMSDTTMGARESLCIAMMAYRDDGLAPSRLHSAINRTTPHASLFFKKRPGPFGVPDGYLYHQNPQKYAQALTSADIVHYHVAFSSAGTRRSLATVFHHHGTMYRDNHLEYNREAAERNALILLSNLELFSWTDGMEAHFLPNVMPVARYRRLREKLQKPWDGTSPFRIAHSPSKPERKGTKEFLAACERISQRGLLIEPVLLHGLSHQDVLLQKATCHAAFDSFWLGMQCSGLEAAAMEVPVIAGDETVAERYIEEFGEVPYTTAWDGEHLERQIERLVTDPEFYARETARVHEYVTDVHDEAAVALRYLDLLDSKFGWRSSKLTTNTKLRRVGGLAR